MPKEVKKEVISFFDPIRKTFCDMLVEDAKKFIVEAKRVEKILAQKKDEQ